MTEPLGLGMEETPDRHGAFPRLDDEQQARFRAAGEVRTVQPRELLFSEGDAGYDFFVVESGAVAMVDGHGSENRVVAIHGPHKFVGELSVLTGAPAQLTAVVRDAGEVIQMPAARLREIVAEDEDLSNLILRAFLARRTILIDLGAGVKVVGSRYSRDAQRLREFLARNRTPYHWMDLEDDEEADILVRALGVEPAETPVVVGARGVLRNPSNAEVGAMLGLGSRGAPPPLCDLVIVGGGPAGLAAAVYGASEGLDTQAIDSVAFGGQAGTSSRIENYLGFPGGVSGDELASRALQQAQRLGAEILVTRTVARIDAATRHVHLDGGDVIRARTIVLACGVAWRQLAIDGFDRLTGKGIFYGAARSEAPNAHGLDIHIIGAGNSAGQAAMFFSSHANSVTLICRGSSLHKSMSRYLIDQIATRPNISLLSRSQVTAVHGDASLEAIDVHNSETDATTRLESGGLFVFIGADAHTQWLPPEVVLDERGFVLTGPEMRANANWELERDPYLLETSAPGIFACGDVRLGPVKRVASAVGEGSMAIAFVHQYLRDTAPAQTPTI
jgi:thioredoxin reductase (NADPH)